MPRVKEVVDGGILLFDHLYRTRMAIGDQCGNEMNSSDFVRENVKCLLKTFHLYRYKIIPNSFGYWIPELMFHDYIKYFS